jgi:hypothetical protein
MKLPVRIAAARRRLRRTDQDRPFFQKRLEEYSPEEKTLAISVFDRALQQMKDELQRLLAETSRSKQ